MRSRRVPSLFMPARLLHTKSVFVTGYALCLFPTSCVYSDSQDCSCLRRVGSVSLPVCLGLLLPAPARLLHMKSVFVAGYALCHFPTSCVFPRPWPRPPPCDFPRPRPRLRPRRAPCDFLRQHPHTRTHAVRGPVSRPPLYPLYGPNVTACRTRSPILRCLPVPSGAVACSTGS